jgi:NADPH:quinone reductase-like Zn-dependent oxidoreductase
MIYVYADLNNAGSGRVLVTGASGGVGRYAGQLAARAGAYVIASAGLSRPWRSLRGVLDAGAPIMAYKTDSFGPVR